MNASSEFIRGYTEIIILSILYKKNDYIYNISNTINKIGDGYITITNPSLLIILKKMCEEGKVSSFNVLNEKNVNRKFYKITSFGKEFYKKNINNYLKSLEKLKLLLTMGEKYDKEN